jgi:hypothetical protein
MKKLLTFGVSLSLVALMGLTARAGAAPAPAPAAAAGASSGGLFVESEESMSSKLVVSGELRTRWEGIRRNMTDFSTENHDFGEYVDNRLRLGLLFSLASNYEVFVQAQNRSVWGGRNGQNTVGGGNEEDVDSFNVYQAYVRMQPNILGYDTVLTVGRQEISLGSEMLLGNDSKYAGISWDAVRLDFQPIDSLSTSVFVAKIVENSVEFGASDGVSLDNFTNTTNGSVDDTHLYGVWNTYHFNDDTLLDAYVLYLYENDEGGGQYTLYGVDAKVFTIGARVKADKLELFGQKFDASAELAIQAGQVNIGNEDLDIQDAFAFEWELGWSPAIMWSPRFAVGMAWASGDDDATDGNYNRFNSLFQDSRMGSSDLFVLENLRCWYAEASFKPMDSEKLTAGARYLKYNAFEEYDAQGVGGGTFGGSNVNDTADEFNVWMGYKLSGNADLGACWSWIEPDDQIHDTAGYGNSPAHRVNLTLTVKF